MRSLGRTSVLLAALVALAVPSAAVAADAVDVAMTHVRANAGDLGVAASDVTELGVTSSYTSKHNGVTHVNVAQEHQGLEVFGGYATVNVDRNGKVVFTGGSLVAGIEIAADAQRLDAADAVAAAADALGLDAPEGLKILELDLASGEALLSGGGISESPIVAKTGWQPTKEGLRLAWQVTIDDATDIHLWNATVDAGTGALLKKVDWTIEDEIEDLAATVHGGKVPAPPGASAPARGFSLSPVADGSCYRVYELALESPNDGDRRLVCNPADATASPFGWHDTDGASGADFTITRGNNSHAYFDQDSNNAADFGTDVNGGAGLSFDFPADLTEHSQAYRAAVVTNLFFGCNTFHDLLYIRGWDEAAGNFQANNYGKGGLAGDYVRCEAADGGGTNNANFSTPSEPTTTGGVPRMQMFLWPGNQFGAQNQVVVGDSTFNAGWARFGPPALNAGVAGTLVLASNNGCNAADYPAGSGFVAITVNVTSGAGSCTNVVRTAAAQNAGASAVVIANTSGTGTGAGPVLTGAQTATSVGIPAVSVTFETGNALRALAGQSATVRKAPAHPGIRDGDFDNGIVFHEYGHGMSIRLTGGPAVNCLGGNEQQGEGWSDYVANVSMIDPALDDPQAARGMGPYALFQSDRHGNGIRPRPYSRTMTIQPVTYDSIKTNAWLTGSLAVPHGIGHSWAAVLWDYTWDLIDKHGFASNIYSAWDSGGNTRAMQYMVDGLKLQGCNPTFVRSRDAILAAANVLGGGEPGALAGDSCTIWASFSRRGVGYSAVGGGTGRDDNSEAFDTHPGCRRGFQSPIHQEYGQLSAVAAGRSVPLRFTATGATGLDILMPTNSPFSRRVDCETLAVPSIGERITPREYPLDTSPSGKSGLSRSSSGVYTYTWKTQESWVGTCREFVVTRKDGVQHRAFFRFVEAT